MVNVIIVFMVGFELNVIIGCVFFMVSLINMVSINVVDFSYLVFGVIFEQFMDVEFFFIYGSFGIYEII